MKTLWQKLILLSAAALFTACAATPYHTPDIKVPDQYNGATISGGETIVRPSADQPASAVANDPWWTAFGDTAFDALIERLFERNSDLAVATLRVRRAQLAAGLSRDARYPHLSGQTSASTGRQLDTGDSTGKNFSASLQASYEIDLWNQLGLAASAAAWEATATAEDREATALALVGTTASAYWQLGYLNQRIASTQASMTLAQRTLELVNTQYQSGAVSQLEVREAEKSLQNLEITLASLHQQRIETRHALTLLLDGQTLPEQDEPQNLAAVQSPVIEAGLPAELLGRRPDLRAAEQRLRVSLANIDITRRSYYPGLSLTGSAGSSSSELSNLLKNPVGTLGAGLTLPFLRFNERNLKVATAKTDYAIAVTQFRQTLLAALADVDNALTARNSWNTQVAALTDNLGKAQDIERLYEVRYRAGAVPLKSWLDAQESTRSAELALAQTRLSQLQNDISLFQALGGSARPTEHDQ